MTPTEAKAIFAVQCTEEGQGLNDKQAAKRVAEMAGEKTAERSSHDVPVSSLLIPSGDVALPSGATELTPVGQEWYTFMWNGHKFLARTEDSKGLTTKKVVAYMERVD